MSKRISPLRRIGMAYRRAYRLLRDWRTIAGGFVLAGLLYLAQNLRDTLVGNMLAAWFSQVTSWLGLGVLRAFQDHPYLLVFSLFVLCNIVLLAHAYIATRPPKGLKVYDGKYGNDVRVIIENNTGHDLLNCEALVTEIVPLGSTESEPYPFLGLHPKLRWHTQGFPNGITVEIKDKTKGIFGTATFIKFKNEPEIPSLEFPYVYELHRGKSRADILFNGYTRQGDTFNYDIHAEFDYDGKNLHVEIWT